MIRGTDLDMPTAQCLRALNPLQGLKLKGGFGQGTLDAALRCHGQSLRKLSLILHDSTVLSYHQAREIQERCPRLEEIKLRVCRHQGGPEGVAVYRALGRMPRLRRAILFLDVDVPSPLDARELAVPENIEQIRELLINLALDETLARAIFLEITDIAHSPLERLTIRSYGPHLGILNPWIYGYRAAVWRWVCTRYGAGGEVTVHQSGDLEYHKARMRGDAQYAPDGIRAVWAELWPRRGEDWTDD